MADRLTHTADARDEGDRADVVLARSHDRLSRRVVRRLALQGHLYVDGRKSPPSTRVRAGQVLELHVREHAPPEPARVLAVSARFVYVDKPAGMATHRLGPDEPPALADAVALVHPECATSSTSPREGGAVHRLDVDTTGVVAFARDPASWLAGRAALASGGGADKRYVAIASHPGPRSASPPWPPADGRWWNTASPATARELHPDVSVAMEVRAPLSRDDRRGVKTSDLGQPAHTTIGALRLAKTDTPEPELWLGTFVLRLHTGRRHQARVHLSALGWPILGDARYGGATWGTLMLHAAHLDLGAAVKGEPPVQAPWPSAMLHAAQRAHVLPSRAPGLLTAPSA